MSADEASIRSTSTMSSLKKLIPRKDKTVNDKDRKSNNEKVVRREATSAYLAYRS